MKKGTFEIILLVVGVIVLTITLFLMFSGQLEGARSMYWTNIAIAGGFVVYIVNNWINTNAFNKEIRSLNQHVQALKAEVKAKEIQVVKLQEELKVSTNEKAGLNAQLLEAQEKIAELSATVSELQREKDNPSKPNEA